MKYSKKSKNILSQCDEKLEFLFYAVLEIGLIDITIIEGIRTKYKQNKFYKDGLSKVKWPNSKHNIINEGYKSQAIDVAPYVNGATSWKKEHCIFLAGIILATAKTNKINVRWGGNWDMDFEPVTDQDWLDLVHFELV